MCRVPVHVELLVMTELSSVIEVLYDRVVSSDQASCVCSRACHRRNIGARPLAAARCRCRLLDERWSGNLEEPLGLLRSHRAFPCRATRRRHRNPGSHTQRCRPGRKCICAASSKAPPGVRFGGSAEHGARRRLSASSIGSKPKRAPSSRTHCNCEAQPNYGARDMY